MQIKMAANLILLAATAAAVFFVAPKFKDLEVIPKAKEIISERLRQELVFPRSETPILKTFEWKYKGKQYFIEKTLHQSIFEYYQAAPKTFQYYGSLPDDWEGRYYAMFLDGRKEDLTIAELANSLKQLAIKNDLSDDQLVEFVLSFVQAIPYDDEKARDILSENGTTTMDYPYEILFTNKGVCSEKSILAASILRTLGYGTALFVYHEDNHMALGIQCPKEYSTYGSGYCFAETTSIGNKIGIIPEIDAESNKTVELAAIENAPSQAKALGNAQIFNATTGNEYGGIISTIKINKRIDELRSQMFQLRKSLATQKAEIAEMESELLKMNKRLEKMKPFDDIAAYNKLAKEYNELRLKYEKVVKRYNESAQQYNLKASEFNKLIAQ